MSAPTLMAPAADAAPPARQHDGAILDDQDGLLEGDYPDRRMVYFRSLDAAKRQRLEAAIREWIAIKDR